MSALGGDQLGLDIGGRRKKEWHGVTARDRQRSGLDVKDILFDEKSGQSVKIEDEIFGLGGHVLNDGAHPTDLGSLLKD